MKFNKYSLLTAPAALLMLLSTGGGALANTASAKSTHNKPKTTKFVVKFRKINKKGKNNKKSKKTAPVVEAVQNGKVVKENSGNKNSKKNMVPWNASWNSVMKKSTLPVNHKLVSYNSLLKRARYIDSGINGRTDATPTMWANFYKWHTGDKRAFSDHAKTFPGYHRLETADHNVNAQRAGSAWAIVTPHSYNEYHSSNTAWNRNRNGELLGNKVLSRFTPYMLNQLHLVEVPAKNGQRVLTSFKQAMKKSNNHPTLMLGHVKYVYNPNRIMFQPAQGINGNGNTYEFNTKTNHYEQVSTANTSKQLTQSSSQLQKEIDQVGASNAKDAASNPKFSVGAQNQMQSVMSNATIAKKYPKTAHALTIFLNGPEAGYKALANDNELDASQREIAINLAFEASSNRLPNQIANQIRSMKNGDKDVTFTMNESQRFDIMALYEKDAFKGLSQNDAVALARYLVQSPTAMDAYLAKYNVEPNVHPSSDAQATAKAANAKADQSSDKGEDQANENAFITSNANILKQHNFNHDQALQLAKALGI